MSVSVLTRWVRGPCLLVLLCAAPVEGVRGQDGEAKQLLSDRRIYAQPQNGGDGLRELASGSILVTGSGGLLVAAAGLEKPELWKLGREGEVVDTGYLSWSAPGTSVRVQWEKGKAEERGVKRAGVLPWKVTGERFAAFRLSDWLVSRREPVGLPFFGGEPVAFRFAGDGSVGVGLKEGGEAAGRWWWSAGRLHVRIAGIEDVGTYEWRALAASVGWKSDMRAAVVSRPVVRPPGAAEKAMKEPEALPGAAWVCRRDVLKGLLASAADPSDVVAALGLEKQTLAFCAERQRLVAELVRAEGAIEEARSSGAADKETKAKPTPVKSVSQLAVLKVKPAPPPAAESEKSGESAPDVIAPASEPEPAKKVEIKAPRFGWFSMIGVSGALVAGVTDGRQAWFVSEGDRVPGAGLVTRVKGSPPAVRIAGLGLLPVTRKPGLGVEAAEDDKESAGILLAEGASAPEPVTGLAGRARVVDGDTLDVAGVRVRLAGIDAPESRQNCRAGAQVWNCGGLATAALRSRATEVECERRGRDRYGRVVAVCQAGGRELNGWLVSEGWALAHGRESGMYLELQKAAASGKRGMHRGEFVTPWDWRTGKRLKPLAEAGGEGG